MTTDPKISLLLLSSPLGTLFHNYKMPQRSLPVNLNMTRWNHWHIFQIDFSSRPFCVQFTLTIPGFEICYFTYWLKFISNPQINTHDAFSNVHRYVQSRKKRCESPSTHMSPAEVKMGSVPPSCFAFHNVNTSSFHGLFNVTFSAVCWWFFFLTWPPGAVLKCYLVFPNTRTIQCAFQRNYTLDKLCLGMGYSCFGFEFIVLIGELQVHIECDVFK